MPRFQIDLTDVALTRLQRVVDVYNQNNGLSLTVQEWILLNVQEIAISEQLAASERDLRLQSEATHAAAVNAERQRLLETIA